MPARVLLAVTGGIAAYKAVELLRELQQAGHDVTVMQTRAARDFVGEATFAALSGRAVVTDDVGEGGTFPHLDAGRRADVLVVAPATAATLSRLAHGGADDVVSATYLGFEGPVVVAPAMNVRMWMHPATRRNLETLRIDGVYVVEPEEGMLACGDEGAGRLAHVGLVAARVEEVLTRPSGNAVREASPDAASGAWMRGRTVLVTAGGTREPIDAVRSITNRSSGRMGVALARQARARGADVRLIVTSSVDPALYAGITPEAIVDTSAQLAAALREQLPGSDMVLMAAAVSDFTVQPAAGKLVRGESVTLELEPVPDLLAGIADQAHAHGQRPLLVGFAADPGPSGLERAREKLQRKRVDMIVHNDIGRGDIGFESTHNEVTLVTAGDERLVRRAPKDEIAATILDAAVRLLGERAASIRLH